MSKPAASPPVAPDGVHRTVTWLRPAWEARLNAVARRRSPTIHLVMGTVHGLTNLGGAVLAVYAAATNADKQRARHATAFYYLVFATLQLVILVALGHFDVLAANALAPLVGATVYLTVGNWMFVKTSDAQYQRVLSIFIASYGLLILLGA